VIETPATLLRHMALFETLTAEQIERLANETIFRAFEPGDVLMRQNSLGASLYVIQSGIFEIRRQREDGSTMVYGRIGPGEYIGEISMMSGEPRPATVVCLTSGTTLELPRSALEDLLKDDSGLSAALERSVQRGLALLDRDDAARNCQSLDQGGSILTRIREFLRLPVRGA
jgi:CRP-like cAMP-binding protein